MEMRSITTPELVEMIILGHYKYRDDALRPYDPEEPFLASYVTEKEEDDRYLSELSYEELVNLKSKVDANNMAIEDEHRPITDFVSENVWRLPMWSLREVRDRYDIFQCAILLAMGRTTVLQPELAKPLADLVKTDDQSVKLFNGDKKELSKIEVLEKLWKSAEETKPLEGEKLIEHLRSAIPESTRELYPENVYDAAIKVFGILHDGYEKKLNTFMKKLEDKKTTPVENNLYVVEGLPSFKQLACDKVTAWKDLNITPTVAKVKMLAGRQLNDSEAESVLREVSEVKAGARAINIDGRYREDIAERAYMEYVRGYRPQDQGAYEDVYREDTKVKAKPKERPVRSYDGQQEEPDDALPVPKLLFVGIILLIINVLLFKNFWLYIVAIGLIAYNWIGARKPPQGRT